MRSKLRSFLWKFLNSKACYLVAIIIVAFLPTGLLLFAPLVGEKAGESGDLTLGKVVLAYGSNDFWQSIFATLMVAWGTYIYRGRIKSFFLPHLTYVRAPMMLAAAPLIVAKTEGHWEQHGMNMDLDFRYAGRGALEDLKDESAKCTFAAASDVALCKFIHVNRDFRLRVIPFVRITGHLQIFCRGETSEEIQSASSESLKGKRIGYYADSVHEDFLSDLGLRDSNQLVSVPHVFACLNMLTVEKSIDACVLWEPHYCAFKRLAGIQQLTDNKADAYEWYLCLVATKRFLDHNREIARRLSSGLTVAANFCKTNYPVVARECAAFTLSEFTGIQESELSGLLKSGNHHFGVDDNVDGFLKRLGRLGGKSDAMRVGADTLRDSLWPGLQEPGD